MAFALTYERNQIKVYPPATLRPLQHRVASRTIARPRLLRFMSQEQQPLVAITAPAGYGKSTLVADWIANESREHRWISLSPQHNDPVNFWGTIVSAIDSLVPGAGLRACEMISSSQQPPINAALVAMVENLKSALVTRSISSPAVVVLDNYHVIDSRSIHHRLGQLLEVLPSNVRFAVLSRKPLPFLQDSKQLNKRSCVIDTHDLAFTSEELLQVYRQHHGIPCSPVLLATIANRTEGWPYAVHSAQSILSTDSDPARFATRLRGDLSPMREYLYENVFNALPPQVQLFLLFASVLERLVPEQLETLFNQETAALLFDTPTSEKPTRGVGQRQSSEENFSDVNEILEYLDTNHSFVSCLDDQGESFRLHPLFAEMLRSQLRAQDPTLEALLRARFQNNLVKRESMTVL